MSDRDCIRTGRDPLFWYKEYWMHQIYSEGLDVCSRTMGVNPPRLVPDKSGGIKMEGNCRVLYWSKLDLNGECMRLFGKRREESLEFEAVVDVKKLPGTESMGLFAARDFEIGDAVTFVPKFEEESHRLILGGIYARKERNRPESNVYLTANRVLRCMKRIRKGEELVRWWNENETIDYLEQIDRVVISPERMVIGRIGRETISHANGKIVHFSDDTMELAMHRHLNVYCDSHFIPI